MKPIKAIGLVAFVVAAYASFVGTGTAAASHHELVGMCKADEFLLCAPENRIDPNSGFLLGTLIEGVFEGNLEETCGESMSKTEVFEMSEEESGLKGAIIELTFGECKPCTEIVSNPPYGAEVGMTEEAKEEATEEEIEKANESWFLKSSGNATLSGCPFGVKCKFGTSEPQPVPTLEVESIEELLLAILNSNKTIFTLEEGSKLICGNSGKMNARYHLLWTLIDPKTEEVIGTDHIFPTLLTTGA